MIEVEHTLEIARPVDEVFAYLTDVSRLPEWQASAESAELEGELRAGRPDPGGPDVHGPPGSLDARGEPSTSRRGDSRSASSKGRSSYSVEHALEALDGRTRVTFVGRGETHRVPRLMHGTVRRAVERQFVKDLEQLKRDLESA